MAEFEHWCGNCQIRIYIERHYGERLNYQDCPYVCEYGSKMRCSTEPSKTSENVTSGGEIMDNEKMSLL